MSERRVTIRDRASAWALGKLLDKLEKEGRYAATAGLLHKWVARGPNAFQSALDGLVRERGWQAISKSLAVLIETTLGEWIPASLLPSIAFLDLERDPKTGTIHEIAIRISRGLIIEREVLSSRSPDPGISLEFEAIQTVLDNAERQQIDFLVGHNAAAFDIPVLREAGLRVPEVPVVDTLVLSMLLEPLKFSHALGGSHRAVDDTRVNAARFQQLDELLIGFDEDELHWTLDRLARDPNLGIYAYWTAIRVGIDLEQVESPSALTLGGATPKTTSPPDLHPGRDLAETSWRACLARREVPVTRRVTVSDAPGLIAWAETNSAVVVVPAHVLRQYRQRHALSTDLRVWDKTVLETDRWLDLEVLGRWLARSDSDGVSAAFLSRFSRCGGCCRSQLHPGCPIRIGGVVEERLFQKAPDLSGGGYLMDHASWLAHGLAGPALVLEVEHLATAALSAAGQSVLIQELDESLSDCASAYVLARTLQGAEDANGKLSTLVLNADEQANDFQKLCESLLTQDRPYARKAANLLRDADLQVRVQVEVDADGGATSLAIQAVPSGLDPDQWLSSALKTAKEAQYTAGRVGAALSREQVSDFLQRPIASDPHEPVGTLNVAGSGGLGTKFGQPRTLTAAVRHVLGAAEECPPSVLGVPQRLQGVLANAIEQAEVRMYPAHLFGSRRKTIDRLSPTPAYGLAAGRATEPMPPGSRAALMTRLPFPSRVWSLAGRYDPQWDDVYERIIIPQMVLRLYCEWSELTDQSMGMTLLDRRAYVYRWLRDQIQQVIGEVRLVTDPSVPEAEWKRASNALAQGLKEAGQLNAQAGYERIDPTPMLKQLLGAKASWRPYQEEIVRCVLQGEDLLAVLPTGSGKSLCYQVPAMIFGELADGLTVIVSPLLALMRNQVASLRRRGIQGVSSINSDQTREDRQRVMRQIRMGWTIMLFVSPEQLMNTQVREVLFERGIRLLVVDEAHCITEWGHDFRPEYQRLGELMETHAELRAGERPQVLALTATATRAIQREITAGLGIERKPIAGPMRRHEIVPFIQRLDDSPTASRRDLITEFVKSHAPSDGLVYATTRAKTEQLAEDLRDDCADVFPDRRIEHLHAGVEDRSEREARFLDPDGPTSVLASTTAFGMGVDKPDIGWIVHADAPGTVESYVQEIGRAARGSDVTAETLAIVDERDLDLRDWMSQPLDDGEVAAVLRHLRLKGSPHDTMAVVTEKIEALTGIAASKVGSALFALERVGILEILSRGGGPVAVKRGEIPDSPDLNDVEQLLLGMVPESGESVAIDPSVAGQSMRELSVYGLDEVEDALQLLIHRGYLVRCLQTSITPLADDAQHRSERLDQWEDDERRLYTYVNQVLRQSTGAGARLTIRSLQDQIGRPAGMDDLDVILADWRAEGVLEERRGLFDSYIRRPSRGAHHHDIEHVFRERRDLLSALEGIWSRQQLSGTPEPRGPAHDPVLELEHLVMTQQRRLSELAARGIVKWRDEPSRGAAYRVQFQTDQNDDIRRLSTLDLRTHRKSNGYRQMALRSLFETDRNSEAIWDFLEAYFERDDHIPPSVIQARKQLLKGLNQQQADAVTADHEHPLLINAGAGTGKTHALARRLLLLQLQEQIPPEKLLVLSFSKVGAGAITSRCEQLARQIGLRPVRARTFHSFCYKIITLVRGTPSLVGERSVPPGLRGKNKYFNSMRVNEVLLEAYDDLLSHMPAADSSRDEPAAKISDYMGVIDALRSGHPSLSGVVVCPDDLQHPGLPDMLPVPNEEGSLPTHRVYQVYRDYLARLRKRNQTDFAQLIVDAIVALRDEENMRLGFQCRLEHLLVDEYQDTSRAQEELMRLLIGPRTGLTVVGDSDQTIFSFNGSDVSNILGFAERNAQIWPDLKTCVVPLEENYRSTPRILGVASRFIKLNDKRLPKLLRASDQPPSPRHATYRSENPQLRLVDVGDLDASVAFAVSTIQGWLKEGIQPHEIAVLSRIDPTSNNQRALLKRVRSQLHGIRIPVAEGAPSISQDRLRTLVRAIAHESAKSAMPVTKSRLAGLSVSVSEHEAATLARLSEEAARRGIERAQEWLDDLSEPSNRSSDVIADHEPRGVVLSTIHKAKGEEYRRVITLHLGSGVFPPTVSMDYEEERRLLYVAITRAQELAVVTGEHGNTMWAELLEAGGSDVVVEAWRPEAPTPGTKAVPEPDREVDPLGGEQVKAIKSGEPQDDAPPIENEVDEKPISETGLLGQFQDWKNRGNQDGRDSHD